MPKKRKNILLIIPSLGGGGAQNVFREQHKEFSKFHNVYRVVFNKDIVIENNNEILSLDVPAGKNFVLKIYFFVLRILRLRKIKKDLKIDICVSHLNGADYVNILSKGKEKVYFCIHGSMAHNQDMNNFIGLLQKRIMAKFSYRYADKIIPVSKALSQEIQECFDIAPQKLCTIYNFFDIENISYRSKESLNRTYINFFLESYTLITSGRLEMQKNQETLIDLVKEARKYIDVKLIILGDGYKRSEIISTCRKLDLKVYVEGENIDFSSFFDVYLLGFQKNPFKFIARASVFVFPSLWEGFPLALGEAMVCDIPVVSADCPTGPRELLSDKILLTYDLNSAEYAKYGILMPLLDRQLHDYDQHLQVWVEVVIRLCEEKTLRRKYSIKAKDRIHEFSKEKIVDQWHQLLEEEY